MAETAYKVIEHSLRMIWATGESEPISTYDMDLCISILNNLMDYLESKNIDLGFTTITDHTDEVTVADGALLPLKRMLSYELWPMYYRDAVPIQIEKLRNRAKAQLSVLGVTLNDMEYPDTLPYGSGNEKTVGQTEHFYPGVDDS